VLEEIRLAPKADTIAGQSVILHVEQFERALLVTYNALNTSARDLAGIITAAGFVVGPPERLGRIGKQIIIPRDVTG
jgi:hypothetical protein